MKKKEKINRISGKNNAAGFRADSKTKKPVVVAVSGGFDPLHIGHVRMFKKSRALGDKLVVILNNDNWLKKKKGYYFMPQNERREMIEAFAEVDKVVITRHKPNDADMSVCKELLAVKPDIFANGGDRKAGNIPEVSLCKEHGIKMVFNVGAGGKIQSSSWLLGKFLQSAAKQLNGNKPGLSKQGDNQNKKKNK